MLDCGITECFVFNLYTVFFFGYIYLHFVYIATIKILYSTEIVSSIVSSVRLLLLVFPNHRNGAMISKNIRVMILFIRTENILIITYSVDC